MTICLGEIWWMDSPADASVDNKNWTGVKKHG
jgi:hypothetical protein